MKILASSIVILGFVLCSFSVYGEESLPVERDTVDRAHSSDLRPIDNETPTFDTDYEFNFLSLIFKTIFALGLIT